MVEGEPEGEEMRGSVAPRGPVLPSRQEVEDHMRTHRPFRIWCPHCVRGKGREDGHRWADRGEPGIPRVFADYYFLGRKKAANKMEKDQIEAEADAIRFENHYFLICFYLLEKDVEMCESVFHRNSKKLFLCTIFQ